MSRASIPTDARGAAPVAGHVTGRASHDLRAQAERAGAGALPALLLAAEQLAATVQMGGHGRRRAGPGEEFWQYRQALPGDGARGIDWRRSGRSDGEYVRDREWQLAQSLELWVDPGASMAFTGGPGRPTKGDRARLLALALAVLAVRAGERVGLAAGGVAPRPGRGQITVLASVLAGSLLAGSEAPAEEIALPETIAPRSRAVFLSDFLADSAPVTEALSRLAARGVRGVLYQILDPVEEDFPFDGRTIFEAMSGNLRFETREARDLRARYLDRLAARRAELATAAAAAGWQFATHRTDHSAQAALLWLHAALAREV